MLEDPQLALPPVALVVFAAVGSGGESPTVPRSWLCPWVPSITPVWCSAVQLSGCFKGSQ